jgi:uncharacterized protein (DUF2147 family)
MKKLQPVLLLAMLLFFSQAFAQASQSASKEITGLYWSPKKDAKIEIYVKGGKYYGKFVWTAGPRKDSKNPIKSLQNRDLLGLEFLTGFEYHDAVYDGGEIYDPETGKTYSCNMSLEGNKLKVRGYIGISLFGRTEYFERIR